MVGFYARFIPEFSQHAAPLHALKEKGCQFNWTDQHQVAFDTLKKALSEAPVLQIPDFSGEFVLVTDASDLAISAVLNQQVDGSLAPIAYYSRLLSPAELIEILQWDPSIQFTNSKFPMTFILLLLISL